MLLSYLAAPYPPSLFSSGLMYLHVSSKVTSFYFLLFSNTGRKIAEAQLSGFGLECKIWDNSASIFISLESCKITNPCNGNLLLVLGEVSFNQTIFNPYCISTLHYFYIFPSVLSLLFISFFSSLHLLGIILKIKELLMCKLTWQI